MKNIVIVRIANLTHQIEKTDKVIDMHRLHNDPFMANQYEEMKQRFFEKLVKEMLKLHLPFEQTSYYLQRFSQKFTAENAPTSVEKLPELEKLITNS